MKANPEKPYSVSTLKGSQPANLARLAKHLKLRVDGMKHGQIARLVHWRLTRPDMCQPSRFSTPSKRQDYESWWESL